MINLSWRNIETDVEALAEMIQKSGRKFSVIVGVSRGGLIPATLLAHKLNIQRVSTIQIIGYNDKVDSGIRTMIGDIPLSSSLSEILVVDDLSDSGATIRAIQDSYMGLTYATLHYKPAGADAVDFSVREYKQEDWLVYPWE